MVGKKPDYHPNGINDKIKQILTYLAEKEFIYSKGNEITSKVIDVAFNSKKLDECINSERFAVIYLDEIDKILSFKNPTPKDVYVNNDVLLLVFAFLRMLIYRRRNKLMPEEINLDNKNSHEYDIESRRARCPEAYDCYYYEIADELGLTERTVSKAVGFLAELGLIYFEPLPRTKYSHEGREKWRTQHTIFSNKYKREGKYAIASGEDYYLNEVKNKRKRLEQFL